MLVAVQEAEGQGARAMSIFPPDIEPLVSMTITMSLGPAAAAAYHGRKR